MRAPHIAVLLRCENQEFQQEQARAAQQVGLEEGASVELFFAENSAFVQIKQVHELLKRPDDKRPTAIIAELVGGAEGYRSTATAALSAGVSWVEVSGLATLIPDLRDAFPEQFVFSITTHEEDIGRIHAQQCRLLLPMGGSILYVEGPSLQPEARARRQGLEEGLRRSGIRIERTLSGDWTHESAERAMSAFFDRQNGFMPSLVCAQNDEMAIGARRFAIEHDPDWTQLPYLGCDGLPESGLKFVHERLLAGTVVKPVTAGVAVSQVVRALSTGVPVQDITISPESFPHLETLARPSGRPIRSSIRSLRSRG